MLILGISPYHGDSAAVLIADGKIAAAAEEERFTRIKHWAGFPLKSIEYCLRESGADFRDLDFIAIGRNPYANLWKRNIFAWQRLLRSPSFVLERARALAKLENIKVSCGRHFGMEVRKIKNKFRFIEHHDAHLAGSFLVSPFDRSAVLSVDGFGDFVSTRLAIGEGKKIRNLRSVYFPHSLGLFYSAVTQFLGFNKYGDEYKVMGLAPYGQPGFVNDLREIIHSEKDGLFRLDLSYFVHHSQGIKMSWENCEPTLGPLYSNKFIEKFGPPRKEDEPLGDRQRDLAASAQQVCEEIEFKLLNYLQRATKSKNLCLAGGVALNSVANGKILIRTPFREIFIQPAAGDAGTALGAAYCLYNSILGRDRVFEMKTSFWGPGFSDREIEKGLSDYKTELDKTAGQIRKMENEEELLSRTAEEIASGKVVGWFQGRMEWGPRALGNRSILADPRRREMKDVLNQRIKKRESFRPFAPSILLESVGEYFELSYPDPFMLKVYPVRSGKREVIPAVTHVDGSGRLQTVSREENPLYWKLIREFGRITGVPVLLNTSFNENEPIVCTPAEALDCFFRTKMDVLVMGNILIKKGDSN